MGPKASAESQALRRALDRRFRRNPISLLGKTSQTTCISAQPERAARGQNNHIYAQEICRFPLEKNSIVIIANSLPLASYLR
jgi:hypothetical protein